MCTIKISEETKTTAKSAFALSYAKSLVDACLYGASKSEKEKIINGFLSDTENLKYRVIIGTSGRINDKGELVMTENGKEVVCKGATIWQTLNWKTDTKGKVIEKKTVFRVPLGTLETFPSVESVVRHWGEYADRCFNDVMELIEKRRNTIIKEAEKLNGNALTLLEFADVAPAFVEKFSPTYFEGKKYGFEFDAKVIAVFEKTAKK